MRVKVEHNFEYLNGIVEIPADKSISHRAIILSTLAKGKSIIKNFSDGFDPKSSLDVCQKLGARTSFNKNTLTVVSDGILKPYNDLYCGNSGTTIRLMAGILSGQKFESTLTGDASLSKRPMKRIIEPLTMMGASITHQNYHAPLKISDSILNGIEYSSKIASAQVKSCILLAGLFAEGTTVYKEPYPSRNHTELMLEIMGADICCNENFISINKSKLMPLNTCIVGDISSAAYFIVAGLIVPNSDIILKNVGLNPTRTGIIDIINQMGGNIEILNKECTCNEVYGDIRIKYTPSLKPFNISAEVIPKIIDEIPVITLLATQADGTSIIKDAQDLRNKESDRITSTVNELTKLGAKIHETEDGMIIHGKTKLKAISDAETYNDHRLAMTMYIAGLITENELTINNFEWVNISFPSFIKLTESLKK